MRYGFYLPTRGPAATRDGILALAREGERLGLHSAMIADHIVLPVESQSTYPYTLDGKHPSAGAALETLAATPDSGLSRRRGSPSSGLRGSPVSVDHLGPVISGLRQSNAAVLGRRLKAYCGASGAVIVTPAFSGVAPRSNQLTCSTRRLASVAIWKCRASVARLAALVRSLHWC